MIQIIKKLLMYLSFNFNPSINSLSTCVFLPIFICFPTFNGSKKPNEHVNNLMHKVLTKGIYIYGTVK